MIVGPQSVDSNSYMLSLLLLVSLALLACARHNTIRLGRRCGGLGVVQWVLATIDWNRRRDQSSDRIPVQYPGDADEQ